MFATGPYKRPVPFVTVQGVIVSDNVDGESLNLSIEISNEVAKVPRLAQFSNYCLVHSDRKKFNSLVTSPSRLMRHIMGDKQNVRSLALGKGDFEFKAALDRERGTNIFNNTYSITRVVPKTDQLYVAVVSYIEHKERLLLGNITKEIILSKNQTPTNSYVYRLEETVSGYGKAGAIWPGAVHRHEGVFMAGNTHTATKHPEVSQEVVIATKIKDLRVLREAEGFSVIAGPNTSNTSYLSPITLSRNVSGDVHGLFSLSHIDFARENSQFGSLIKNPAALLSATPLEDVVVYQKVVKEDAAGNALTPGRPSRCAITEVSTFKQVASLNNGVQLVNGFNSNQVLNFSFIDATAQEYQSNMLEYKVEIVLKDETQDAMRLTTQSLATALKVQESAQDSISPQQLKSLVDTYLSAVGYLLGPAAFRTRSAPSYQQNLLALINAGTEMRGQVIELIRDFSVGVTEATQPNKNITYGGSDYNSFIYRSKRDNTVRLTHTFQDKFRILYRKGIGLEYVDSTILNAGTPVPGISHPSLESRVTVEGEKYALNNPNAGAINKYGYLTPVATRLRDNPIVVPSTSLANSTKNFTGIIRSTIDTNPALSLEPAKSVSANMVETLSQAGIGVKTNNISIVEIANASENQGGQTTDSTSYLPSGSGFATVDTPQDFIVSGSSAGIAVSNVIPERLESSPLVNTMVNQTVTNFSIVSSITNQANIAGSIPLQKATEDADALLQADSMTNLLNFGSIVQVQYLTNYSQVSGIRQQNWELLTPEIYERTRTAGISLWCRLVLVSETLDAPNLVNLEPLASLFVLGPAPQMRPQLDYQERYEQIRNNLQQTNSQALTSMDSSDTLYAANIPMMTQTATTATLRSTEEARY